MLELIVRYVGDLKRLQEEIGFAAEELLAGYAIVRIAPELAPLLLSAEEILWTEVPARVYTEVTGGKRAACITALQGQRPDLTGRGVLVAIIDSGIDYMHPDFRNEDGTTRIAALWDQTAQEEGEPPAGYFSGTLYTRERIDAALRGERRADGRSLIPEIDLSGHGTHVAGIAAGNGRASGGRYRGVAYESTLLVVKLGGTQTDPFPQTTNLMEAVDFCVRYAADAGLPLSVNISFGNSEGAHDGRSLLETYLDAVSLYGRNSICIGTGNDGNAGLHVGGSLMDSTENGRLTETEILLAVGSEERRLRMGLWVSAVDTIELSLVSPSGTVKRLPENLRGSGTAIKGYPAAGGTVLDFGGTAVEVFVGEATPYRGIREITITLRGENGSVEEGIWRIRMQPVRILDGMYDIWLARGEENTLTRFLRPTPERTLTIPSTAGRPIAVAAFDARTSSIAVFSGRGYPRAEQYIKPDIAAPGVDIVSCAPGGGYTAKTGTSMATPFVTGSAALFLQWGVVLGNDPYLYGERLKTVLIQGAGKLPGLMNYPNTYVGAYGKIVSEILLLVRTEREASQIRFQKDTVLWMAFFKELPHILVAEQGITFQMIRAARGIEGRADGAQNLLAHLPDGGKNGVVCFGKKDAKHGSDGVKNQFFLHRQDDPYAPAVERNIVHTVIDGSAEAFAVVIAAENVGFQSKHILYYLNQTLLQYFVYCFVIIGTPAADGLSGDCHVFDHNVPCQPADADTEELFYGFRGIVRLLHTLPYGGESFFTHIVVEAFMYGIAVIVDGAHIFLFFRKVPDRIIFEIFDAFHAEPPVVCISAVYFQKPPYNGEQLPMSFIHNIHADIKFFVPCHVFYYHAVVLPVVLIVLNRRLPPSGLLTKIISKTSGFVHRKRGKNPVSEKNGE